MSKVDAQRAMREAKYAARNSTGAPTRRGAAAAAAPPTTPAAPTPATRPARAAKAAKTAKAASSTAAPSTAAPAPASESQRCGHKSINGRECTREAGHPEKNHRYG